MIQQAPDYDVAVVGASLAGSAAAMLLARRGARVALIERKPDPAAFKRVCGHFIQPSGVPVLERLGVMPALEAAGAVRGHGEVWTRAGWVGRRSRRTLPPALSIRREVLDPLLRAEAARTPGVELLAGASLEDLEQDAAGVRLALRDRGTRRELRARVVVGADGRGSRTAQLAGMETRRSENLRFGYAGYFQGPPLADGLGVRLWLLEPDVALATPTDGGLILYVAMPHRSRIPEFKADPEAALRAFFATVPDAPPLEQSRRVGPMIGKLDLTNEHRPVTCGRVALVGDAALTSDPVAAIGCGWALQSSEWLADALAPALAGSQPLERALARYARRHGRELGGHAKLLDQFAATETLGAVPRLLFGAAVHDERTAERLGTLAGRLGRPSQVVTPAALARAAAVTLRHRRTGSAPPVAARRAAV